MLRTVIVDDEALARRAVRRLLKPRVDVEIVGEADNVPDAVDLIGRTHPDLVLLDIELGEMDGFDLIGTLDPPPLVVFITAHSRHAVEAFEVKAVDYLLKPIAPERLGKALERVLRILGGPREAGEAPPSLELRTPSRTVLAAPADIAAVTGEGDFSKVLLADQPPLLILRSFTQFESLLPNPPFLRLDRSVIINRDRLRRIDARSRDDVRLTLHGLEEPLEIGRTAAARLRQAIAASRDI